MKTLYIIRHCKAEGQPAEAQLTPEGKAQAERLAEALADRGIGRIIASPFVRAVDTAAPLARRLGLAVETDDRLAERVLTTDPCPDWLDRLRDSFADPDLCLPGGESGRVAMARGVAAIREALAQGTPVTAVVTHGNLMALLLRHFDDRFGFEQWQALSNPDVYLIEGSSVMRVWNT